MDSEGVGVGARRCLCNVRSCSAAAQESAQGVSLLRGVRKCHATNASPKVLMNTHARGLVSDILCDR